MPNDLNEGQSVLSDTHPTGARRWRRPTLLVAMFALVVGSCSASSTPDTTVQGPNSPVVATSISTTAPHTPVWLTVKDRPDAVDVAHPRFAYLNGGSSSLVDAAFYNAVNGYMVISLNGTAYHYCGMPGSVWSAFRAAGSLGSFYQSAVKGRFDCRAGAVPEY